MKFCAILLIFFLYGCANKNQPLTSAQRQPNLKSTQIDRLNEITRSHGVDVGQPTLGEEQRLFDAERRYQEQNPSGPAGKNSNDLLNFQDAKLKCLSIGFKAGTEELGKCVLKFTK